MQAFVFQLLLFPFCIIFVKNVGRRVVARALFIDYFDEAIRGIAQLLLAKL